MSEIRVEKNGVTRSRSALYPVLSIYCPTYINIENDMHKVIDQIKKFAEIEFPGIHIRNHYMYSTNNNDVLLPSQIKSIAESYDMLILRDTKKIPDFLLEEIYYTIYTVNPSIILVLLTDLSMVDSKYNSELQSSLTTITKYVIENTQSNPVYSIDRKIMRVVNGTRTSNKDIIKFIETTSDRNIRRATSNFMSKEELLTMIDANRDTMYITSESTKRDNNIRILNTYKRSFLPQIGEKMLLSKQLIINFSDVISKTHKLIGIPPYTEITIDNIMYDSNTVLEAIDGEPVITLHCSYYNETYGIVKFGARLNLVDYLISNFNIFMPNYSFSADQEKLYDIVRDHIVETKKTNTNCKDQSIMSLLVPSNVLSFSDNKYVTINKDYKVEIIVDRKTQLHELYSALVPLVAPYENVLIRIVDHNL